MDPGGEGGQLNPDMCVTKTEEHYVFSLLQVGSLCISPGMDPGGGDVVPTKPR